MTAAAARFVGERDFAALASGGEGVPWSSRQDWPRGTVRRVLRCDCRALAPWWGPGGGGQLLEVRVVADGFLPRMVRNMVGLLAEVGRGARSPEEIGAVLASRDRRVGPKETAPAHGLTLWRVGYGAEQPADLSAEETDGTAGSAGDRTTM
jgi:tRNA pseudouridine38-40 synthase